jgi:hypothetical protein
MYDIAEKSEGQNLRGGSENAFQRQRATRELINLQGVRVEPTSGLEPLTCRLRIGCSTN